MNKQQLIKAIPYVVLLIAIGFTLYSYAVMHTMENKYNIHLGKQIRIVFHDCCSICTDQQAEIQRIGNFSLGDDMNLTSYYEYFQ